ncbi:unnamed protein product [Parnassius apollo]|uniref:(apollo) hypothetical protein n=1 Tax=Parnassius apollo TaxID=110799 RepID=A0A8S3X2F5_PARAO|nr:unnamed protein product [Parnassius apollo]
MSDDGVINTKFRILELLSELDESELNSIEHWIVSHTFRNDLKLKRIFQNNEKKLIKIGDSLKNYIPIGAELLTENIVPPIVGNQSDCNDINTRHVDGFLYDEDEVEDLVKCGKLNRHYCLDCNSRNVKDLIFISHSLSRQNLLYIFKLLLPKDLEGKQLLDVGSRTGAVLYGAYYLSNASSITGVEINKEYCEIQEKIIGQFSMDKNRVKVIHSDIMDMPDVVRQSDIIVINNLDFFVNIEKHKQVWQFFKKHLKKGSYIVAARSVTDTLNYLGIFEEFMDWLTACKPNQIENEIFFDVEDNSDIFLYTIK